MGLTLDDLVTNNANGYSYADFPTFLLYVQQQYQTIFGNDIYLGIDSQDGLKAASEAQCMYDAAAKGAMTYLSFFVKSAQGSGLARLVKLTGITKEVATSSTVSLTIVGVAGTVITNGVAQDTLGQFWVLPTTVTIPGGGSITVTATSAIIGAIQAAANTITGIFTPTLGWQTVNNAAIAIPGQPVEQDGALRQRQAVSTSLPAQTVFNATVAAVSNVVGVTEVGPYENPTNATDANGLPPHSIALVVQGGANADIANAIMLKKTPGTQTYGTTSVPVIDPKGMPITINFYRPTVAEIGVQVTKTTGPGWSSDYILQIQNAVAAAVNAIPIGKPVILTKLYLAAYLQGTPAFGTFEVDSILIEKNGGGYGSTDIALLFNEIPVCNPLVDVVVI